MAELGTVWLTLAVNTRGMQRDIRQAFGEIDPTREGNRAGDRFGKAATANTNLTGIERKLGEVGKRGAAVLGKALKTGVAGAAAAAIGAVGTSLTLGFSRLSAIDDAQAKLRGLGHDAGTVQKVMDNALASVKGTAFGLGDAAGLAGVIVASGIKPGQELESVLKRVADSAAMSGSSLSDMGMIWAKSAAKGRIDGEIVAQLLERQIPIYDILAAKTGHNAAEIAKMVSKGKIDFQTFSDAMNDKLGGAALSSGETVRGAFDNMKAAMGRMGAEALKPGFNRLPAMFGYLTAEIDKATPRVAAFAQRMSGEFDKLVERGKTAWQQLADNGALRDGLNDTLDVLSLMVHAAKSLVQPLVGVARSLGSASAALGVSSWRLLLTALEAVSGVVHGLAGPLNTLADLMERHQGLVTAAVAAYAAFRGIPTLFARLKPAFGATNTAMDQLRSSARQGVTGMRDFGGAYRTSLQWVRQANPTISTAGAHLQVLGTNARVAATGGLSAIRSAAQGVVGVLGGPLNIALMAAGAAFAYISNQNQKAAHSLDAYNKAVRNTTNAQIELHRALLDSGGSVEDDLVSQKAIDRVRAVGQELETAGERTGTFWDKFRNEDHSFNWGSLFDGPTPINAGRGDDRPDTYHMKIEREANAAKAAKQVLDDLKITQEELADVTYGGQIAFDQLSRKLKATGASGEEVANKLAQARQEFQRSQQIAKSSVPGISSMADAMKVLGDNTATAADKTKALTNALAALNPERTLGDAIAQHDQVLMDIAESSQSATDATQGFGQALISGTGGIATATRNGQALRTSILSMVDASASAVGAGQALDEVNSKNANSIASLASQYGVSVQQIQTWFDQLGGADLALTATLSGQDEVIQSLGLVGRAFQEVPDRKDIVLDTSQVAGSEQALESLGFKLEEIDGHPGQVRVVADTDDAQTRLQSIIDLMTSGGLPEEKPIKVTDQGGQAIFDLLKSIGEQVTTDNDKSIKVEAPLGGQVKRLLGELGYEVRTNNDKTIEVKLTGVQAARDTLAELTGGRRANIPVPRADGAIVPRANGGLNLKQIIKPSTAGIYAGRGDGTVFAERETGGEAYIPLAASKRGRSELILSEVASLFGYQLSHMEDGGVTANQLKRFATQISGRKYAFGAGNGDTFDTDCSGAQSTMANFITGGVGRFGTASQSQALTARGFQFGAPPEGISAYWIGWENGGPGGGHTAGTIVDPYGGNINVEMGGRSGNGQYGGTAAGASAFPNQAWVALASGDDPNGSNTFSAKQQRKIQTATAGVTSARASVTSAQASADSARSQVAQLQSEGASSDKIANAQTKADAAEQRLTAAQQRLAIAEDKLTDAQTAVDDEKTSRKSGASGGEDLGQAFVSGIMQTIGLDGSVFSNPMEWPNFKSAMGALNWGGGLFKNMLSGGEEEGSATGLGTGLGGGASLGLDGLSLPGVGDLLGTVPTGPLSPSDPNAHGRQEGAPGPLVQYNGPVNMGVDPTQFTQKQNANTNAAVRSNLGRRG